MRSMGNRFKDTVAFSVLILDRLFTGILICGHGRLREEIGVVENWLGYQGSRAYVTG